MKEELAHLFYDTDIIQIRTGELKIDFTRAYIQTSAIFKLSRLVAKELDDYAIDSICCIDEGLPFAVNLASELELPFQWLRNKKLSPNLKETKRTMFFSLISPSNQDALLIRSLLAEHGVELVGIYSLIGFDYTGTGVRQFQLVKISELFEIYHALHLITHEEFENLVRLGNEAEEAQVTNSSPVS